MNIEVSVPKQLLTVFEQERVIKSYSVATARRGVGEHYGSFQTPRGRHVIRAKIGGDVPVNTVFIARRPTGEIYNEVLANRSESNRDWILTRILWLCGQEPGLNRFGQVDTMKRKIYIHGCPDSHEMGVPSSHGCIKMRNDDIVELFELVDAGVEVNIVA